MRYHAVNGGTRVAIYRPHTAINVPLFVQPYHK